MATCGFIVPRVPTKKKKDTRYTTEYPYICCQNTFCFLLRFGRVGKQKAIISIENFHQQPTISFTIAPDTIHLSVGDVGAYVRTDQLCQFYSYLPFVVKTLRSKCHKRNSSLRSFLFVFFKPPVASRLEATSAKEYVFESYPKGNMTAKKKKKNYIKDVRQQNKRIRLRYSLSLQT